jgi:hypothetical protein
MLPPVRRESVRGRIEPPIEPPVVPPMEPPVLPPVIPPVLPPTVSPPEVLVAPPRSFCVRTPDEMLPVCAELSEAAPKVSARAMPNAQEFVIRSVICSSSTRVCAACPAGGSGWGI